MISVLRRCIAEWIYPEGVAQLSACRTAWAKHYLDVSHHEGTDFLDLDGMTEQERVEVRKMKALAMTQDG